jgi:phospholipid-binding lipoprotein MlaA
MSFFSRLVIILSLLAASGCASLPAGNISDPRDPLERYNRTVFDFNDGVDRAVVKPLAQAYRDYVPVLFQNSLRNFFSNLRDVIITAHQLLQAKPEAAATAGGRVLINTTIGILGLRDPASSMGLTKSNEDFGQTFGRWGVGPGPYFVLPLLGPSTLRDAVGTVADFSLDPIGSVFEQGTGRTLAYGLIAIDRRKDLLDAQDTIEALSFDRYSGVRDAWLARRRSLVYDGEPPPEKFKED